MTQTATATINGTEYTVKHYGGVPKTLLNYCLKHADKIDEVGREYGNRMYGNRSDYWVYTRDGFYSPEMESHTIHEDTIKDTIAVCSNIQACDCKDCIDVAAKASPQQEKIKEMLTESLEKLQETHGYKTGQSWAATSAVRIRKELAAGVEKTYSSEAVRISPYLAVLITPHPADIHIGGVEFDDGSEYRSVNVCGDFKGYNGLGQSPEVLAADYVGRIVRVSSSHIFKSLSDAGRLVARELLDEATKSMQEVREQSKTHSRPMVWGGYWIRDNNIDCEPVAQALEQALV